MLTSINIDAIYRGLYRFTCSFYISIATSINIDTIEVCTAFPTAFVYCMQLQNACLLNLCSSAKYFHHY
jgi:hypothetical protein